MASFPEHASHSRRDFLCATAAALLAGHTVSAGNPAAELKSMGCTLGFSTYGMKTLTTEDAVRALSEIGFDAVEIIVRSGWNADSTTLDTNRRTTLRKLISDSGLELSSLMEHVFPLGDSHHANALKRLKLAAGVAHDLSPDFPPLIQTVLGGGDFQQRKTELRDRLGEWVDVAESTNTVIAIKPHRGGVVSRPSEAVWLFEQLGKPQSLRMVYDYSHYAFRGLPLRQTIATALPFTAHIAVKDAEKKDGRIAFNLPGQAGTIDFAELIRLFHAGGYRGDVNCEVSSMVWNKADYEPIAAARTCYKNLNRAFQSSNVVRRSR